jgi:hypothetical protein
VSRLGVDGQPHPREPLVFAAASAVAKARQFPLGGRVLENVVTDRLREGEFAFVKPGEAGVWVTDRLLAIVERTSTTVSRRRCWRIMRLEERDPAHG